MKMIKFIILGLALSYNISCDKDEVFELNETNYLIFGHFYGECSGEGCVEIFKVTNKKLYEDMNDHYSGGNLNFIELGNDKFKQVKDLVIFFPTQLLNDNTTTFGCPDCADGGGLFIQYSENGTIKSWRIDQIKSNVPKYLHAFMDKVNEKIALINN